VASLLNSVINPASESADEPISELQMAMYRIGHKTKEILIRDPGNQIIPEPKQEGKLSVSSRVRGAIRMQRSVTLIVSCSLEHSYPLPYPVYQP
jgi:hypothetical protein